MSQPTPNELDMLRRQLLAHARHWRGAGVEWLAQGGPIDPASAARSVSESASKAADVSQPEQATSMFEIAAEATPNAAGGMTLEERRLSLRTLADEVKSCTRCAELCSTRTQTVFADGPPGAEVCFVGEAPGADEDAQGVPFVGAAGQLLTKIIVASGFKREEVYICNILKCRPPGNRTPLANEAANCRGFLERQLELAQPKFIVALGSCAASNLLQSTLSVGKLRGRFHSFKGIPVMVTYHPAYLLPHRSPEKKREVWEDMKMLLQKMGRSIPQK